MLGGLLFLAFSCNQAETDEQPVWPEITKESKPWTRWWWMGSAVDQSGISQLLDLYAESGFGGVEITPIYGVKGAEQRNIDFLSSQWIKMLEHTAGEAERLNMGVDMNLGTGWPFGGPVITPEYAASQITVRKIQFHDGQYPNMPLEMNETELLARGAVPEAITAYGPDGQVLQLMEKVDSEGKLQWRPQKGDWELLVTYCDKTGQYVKRAAPGGEGYSLDHFSKEGVQLYLERFGKVLPGSSGVRSFFNDSYEVYNANWTPGLFQEFQNRRGYDLRNHIRAFISEEDSDLVARIKCDYRQTLSELLLEYFTESWTDWAHQRKGLTKNQAHGSPANLLDLYATVDIPECETFGHTRFEINGLRQDSSDQRNAEPDPFMLKIATSAAHISGKKLISNETFTWLGEHFRVSLAQCKPEAEEALLAGINHLFYHGTTYSPKDETWPGWLFYASTNFAPSNSFWPHLKGLNSYVTRCQSLLQTGKPDNENLVYWPIFDVWNTPDGLEKQLSVHNTDAWLKVPAVRKMAQSGYAFDFISDRWLDSCTVTGGSIVTSPESHPYRTLIIPSCQYMPLETLKRILKLAENGARVVFQQLPLDVPGLYEYEKRRSELLAQLKMIEIQEGKNGVGVCKIGEGVILLSENIENALAYSGFKTESINDFGLKYTRRRLDDGKIYFLVNHTPYPVDTLVTINGEAKSVLILDPQSGGYGLARIKRLKDQTGVRVQIASGEALFLRTYTGKSPVSRQWDYFRIAAPSKVLTGKWSLEFSEGGPTIPEKQQLISPELWTDLGDSAMLHYAGLGVYSVSFEMNGLTADQYMLDLGLVCESARIWLNGEEVGILYSNPFTILAGEFLKEGKNELIIEVANLMANRIRYLEKSGFNWKKFHDINFVNIQYKPFDASGWQPMKSGLGGQVRLIPLKKVY